MRVVLDLQTAQLAPASGSERAFWIQLVKQFALIADWKIFVVLDGRLTRSVSEIRASLKNSLSPESVTVCSFPEWGPATQLDRDARARIDCALWQNLLVQLCPEIVQFSSSRLPDGWYPHWRKEKIGDLVGAIVTFSGQFESHWSTTPRADAHPAVEADLMVAVDSKAKREAIATFAFPSDRIVVLADGLFTLESAPSWDLAMSRLVSAYQRVVRPKISDVWLAPATQRPKLAFVSPLPPEKSGIANYSAALLRGLSRYYEITCIVDQPASADSWIQKNLPVRDVPWIENSGEGFDRFLYQVGNNQTHKHVFHLSQRFPGVAVLHDIFLGHLVHWMDATAYCPNAFLNEIYREAGWTALLDDRRHGNDWSKQHYQANGELLQNSIGAIVHSSFAAGLLRANPLLDSGKPVRVLPFLPYPPKIPGRAEARQKLDFADREFVVCSFGWLAPEKRNDLLLSAWLNSTLARDPNCRLVFVGEDPSNWISPNIAAAKADRVAKTGYITDTQYGQYLGAADVAVQMRMNSRGETSGTIFDCLASGLPVITNAHGANRELPAGVVLSLAEMCSDSDLTGALEAMRSQPDLRESLTKQGLNYLASKHSLDYIASNYFESIESIYQRSPLQHELQFMADLRRQSERAALPSRDLGKLCLAISQNRTSEPGQKVLLDLTSVSGRVRLSVRRQIGDALSAWMWKSRDHFRVEPVRNTQSRLVYARALTAELLRLKAQLPDSVLEVNTRGRLVTFDFSLPTISSLCQFTRPFRNYGGHTILCVSDLKALAARSGRNAGIGSEVEFVKAVAAEFDRVFFAEKSDQEWFSNRCESLSAQDVPSPTKQIYIGDALDEHRKASRQDQLAIWISYLAKALREGGPPLLDGEAI